MSLASDKLTDWHFTGDTQCLPLYRYPSDGNRVSNITGWGLRQFREHYGDDAITDEDIFAYVYAMLHDPAYRQRYEIDLRREFPRVYFHDDFAWWAEQGRALLDLHIGFESAEPWPLERVDQDPHPDRRRATRAILRADQDRGRIRPRRHRPRWPASRPRPGTIASAAARPSNGSSTSTRRSKPRDPTIRERFNTYRFADYKERVIDLLGRVCSVSVQTVHIVNHLGDRSAIAAAPTEAPTK